MDDDMLLSEGQILTARYRLGELLRDSADHLLLLTATPHKGDPANFTLFVQLLDEDAYADVKSIREAHYTLSVNALVEPMEVQETPKPYGGSSR